MTIRFARSYLKKGISFYPLSNDKRPPCIDRRFIHGKMSLIRLSWKKYQYELPSEYDIHYWFNIMKCKNIAICTGDISNLAVVDCDSDSAVKEYTDLFSSEIGYSAFDLTHVKTKRGFHFYYKYSGEHRSTELFDNPEIELKLNGASIKAPPSIRDGFQYIFSGNGMIETPKFIITELNKPKKIIKTDFKPIISSEYLKDGTYWLDRALMRDDRNNACFWMCDQMLNDGIPLNDVRGIVEMYVSLVDQSKDIFDISEAMQCLSSAINFPRREPARSIS